MSADTVYQQLRKHLHYLGLRAAADILAPRWRPRRAFMRDSSNP